jgi:3-hydroxyacyl-[acyl-carrier-protein] dehydratase
VLDRTAIQRILPHRDPFLFLDRITEIEYGKYAVGEIDEVGAFTHILKGHFPGFPVLPGAIILEACAEVGAVAALGLPENAGKIAMLTGADGWRWRQPATPGAGLTLRAELIRMRGNFGKGHCVATRNGQLVAEGDISFAIVDRPASWRVDAEPAEQG